jgi:hypothetical protein
MGGSCHSFSNDATILLPTPALKGEYLVIARQTFTLIQNDGLGNMASTPIPGFFAVVATDDNTNVAVTYSAYTEPGGSLPTQQPGQMVNYMLNKGDVLQIASQRAPSPCANMSTDMLPNGGTDTYCDLGPKWDLTGTHVVADKAVEVFGGHSCSFVPFNRWACDHLESTIFPLDTWGKQVIAVQTEPQVPMEPNVFRVISGSDGNMVTFDPAVHPPVMLNSGAYIEFTAQGGFLATGTGRTAIGQYMVGENYFGNTTPAPVGDPSQGMGMNVDQFRTSYDFLTPATYTKSYVSMIAPMNATLMLDGTAVTGFTAIGGSGYGYKRILLPAPAAGTSGSAHHVTGDQKFGISVSGVASYTSYLYVGGQDFNDIPVQ